MPYCLLQFVYDSVAEYAEQAAINCTRIDALEGNYYRRRWVRWPSRCAWAWMSMPKDDNRSIGSFRMIWITRNGSE